MGSSDSDMGENFKVWNKKSNSNYESSEFWHKSMKPEDFKAVLEK